MSMDILCEINFPDGRCWTTTPLYSQAVDAAKAKAKKDGVPMEVAKYNLRTGKVFRNTYFPDGRVEKIGKRGDNMPAYNHTVSAGSAKPTSVQTRRDVIRSLLPVTNEDEEPEMEEDDHPVTSSTDGDYSPSHPWDAPGMSASDFIEVSN